MARAEQAWRGIAPSGPGAEALLRHGRRVWLLLAGGDETAGVERPAAVAALLHEAGRFLPDRGHHALRAARWVASMMDRILPDARADEHRLVGELILFHRHRGPLPPELVRPALVERFRRVEGWDRSGGGAPDGLAAERRAAVETQEPRGRLTGALLLSDLRERLRSPLAAGRVHRIRRPDR